MEDSAGNCEALTTELPLAAEVEVDAENATASPAGFAVTSGLLVEPNSGAEA